MRYLRIGELSKEAHVSKVAIRYYERHGLLPKASRNMSGYRQYPESAIAQIHFIKNAKAVGFTLSEIEELLALQANERGSSRQVKSHTVAKLEVIHQKITALQKIAQVLEHLSISCDGNVPLDQCPILEALYGDMADVVTESVTAVKK